MNVKAAFACGLLIALAAASAFYALRHTGGSVSRRLPNLLELSVPLFLIGLALLPQAFPSAFAVMLHHSIASDYIHPIQADGTRITETWVLARWWTPISRILYGSVFTGILWAVWNIFRAEDRKMNVFSLCVGLLWAGLGAIINLRMFPF